MQKLLTAKIFAYMPYLIIKLLTGTLTNHIVSFEQLGPELERLNTIVQKQSYTNYLHALENIIKRAYAYINL